MRYKLYLSVLAACALIIYGLIAAGRAKDDAASITKVMELIRIGATPGEARSVFSEYQDERLRLREIDETEWLITSPIQFGAVNWNLWINFKDRRVSRLAIRLADNKSMKPENSPPDKD